MASRIHYVIGMEDREPEDAMEIAEEAQKFPLANLSYEYCLEDRLWLVLWSGDCPTALEITAYLLS